MADVVDPLTRSRMMAGIKGKDTKPELLVRSYLHQRGLRFRLNSRKLPGKPDIVLPRYCTVVFIHGCFWHRHLCRTFVWPKTRPEFWKSKLDANAARDEKNAKQLKAQGWQVCIVWECELSPENLDALLEKIRARGARGHLAQPMT